MSNLFSDCSTRWGVSGPSPWSLWSLTSSTYSANSGIFRQLLEWSFSRIVIFLVHTSWMTSGCRDDFAIHHPLRSHTSSLIPRLDGIYLFSPRVRHIIWINQWKWVKVCGDIVKNMECCKTVEAASYFTRAPVIKLPDKSLLGTALTSHELFHRNGRCNIYKFVT